jgi:hypothetical protein
VSGLFFGNPFACPGNSLLKTGDNSIKTTGRKCLWFFLLRKVGQREKKKEADKKEKNKNELRSRRR